MIRLNTQQIGLDKPSNLKKNKTLMERPLVANKSLFSQLTNKSSMKINNRQKKGSHVSEQNFFGKALPKEENL